MVHILIYDNNIVITLQQKSVASSKLIFFYVLCVCFLPIYSEPPSSLDVPAGVTQEEGQTGFLILFCGACLYFSREKDSAVPFPRRL